jgi:hypothetical protein
MSKEHFNTGSGEGKGSIPGLIPPSAGPEPDVMPVQRGRSKEVFGVQYNKDAEGGVAAEEVIDQTPAAPYARVPLSGGNLAQGGQHPGQTMKTKDIHSGLHDVHRILDTVARNASSLKSLHPDHQDAIVAARQHLNEAGSHLSEGKTTGIGTNSPDTAATKMSFSKAAGHISKAHALLSDDGLQAKLSKHKLGGEVPDGSHIAELSGHVGSMRGEGAGGKQGVNRSFKTIAIGKSTIPTKSISKEDLAAMKEAGGSNHLLVKKVEAALRGTEKGGGELVSPEKYEEARDAGQVRSTRSGMTSGPKINPKKRATGATVRTKISGGSKIGKTPTFGESGGAGKQKGDAFEQPKPDRAKNDPNQNRGGRGGAV